MNQEDRSPVGMRLDDDSVTSTGNSAPPTPGRPIAPSVYRFPADPADWLPWSHVEQRLEAARTYWLVTASAAAVPHATPIWGVWVQGAFYFDGLPTTRWARNIAATSRATVHLESGEDVVIIDGHADDITTTTELGDHIVAAWNTKYHRLAPEPATDGLFRLRPETARAWSDPSLHDGTRWSLPTESSQVH